MNEANARRFLLGDVDESERQRIERLVILHPEVKETILIVEEDLIEEFLDGDLSSADKQKFLARCASTSPQQAKLQIAESLRRRAVAMSQSVPEQTAPVKLNWFGSFVLSLWRQKHPFLIPATALVLALAVVAIWLIDRNNRRLQENDRLNSIQRQFSQLNSPSELATNPPQMRAVVLSPVATRSLSGGTEPEPGSTYAIVELRLLWIQEGNYQNYEAIIRRATAAENFKVSNLRLEQTDRGNVIKLRAPAEFFERGVYQISLSSFTKDGAPGPVEEYTFAAGR